MRYIESLYKGDFGFRRIAMNRTTKLILAGLLASTFASIAAAADLTPVEQPMVAQPVDSGTGFYVGSLSSATFMDDTDFDVAGGLFNVNTDYDVGYYSALRAGYNFGSMGFVAPRIELEVGYGNASVDNHSVNGFGVDSIDSYGDARTIQGFVNGYLDIPLAAPGETGFLSGITPYVGGGVGAINMKLKKQGIAGFATLMDDSDTRFAYHLDAGLGINLQAIGLFTNTALFNGTTMDIGYRYTAADDFSFTAREGTTSKTDFSSNAITIGFRKQF